MKKYFFISVLFGIILGFFYFLFATSFFRENFIYLIHGFNLIYVIVIGFALMYTLKIKKKSLRVLTTGGFLLLLIQRVIDVILQKYNMLEIMNGISYYTISIMIWFFGFYFLLIVFERILLKGDER